MRNVNEIFRKDVTYDNIKSHKKSTLSLEDTFFCKSRKGRGVKLTPLSLLRVNVEKFLKDSSSVLCHWEYFPFNDQDYCHIFIENFKILSSNK